MARPRPTKAFHFTHIDNLASIAHDGLVCDTHAHGPGRLVVEVGNLEVKDRRRRRAVDVGAGGVVADYVPFYFTPRNLMLYQIHTRRVPHYERGQEGLIFLCTTLERVDELMLPWVVCNRNASTTLARFTDDLAAVEEHVDWPLASSPSFKKAPDDPDRPQRHQAELLVHHRVPWEAIQFIGTRTEADLSRVEHHIGNLGGYQPRRDVRPHWYF